MAALQDGIIGRIAAAGLIKVTPQTLGRLVKEGYINQVGRDRYNLVDVVHGRLRSLEDQAKHSRQTQTSAELQREKTLQIRQRREQEAGTLILYEEHLALFEVMIGILRVALAGLPANITRDLTERARIEKVCDKVLADISSRFAEGSADILKAVGADGSAEASEPAAVGKGKRSLSADKRQAGSARA